MIGKIKAFGLTIVALAAMSAFAASAAQAGSFDIGASPAVVKGHSETGQNHILSFKSTNGSPFNSICTTASFEGTTTGQVQVTDATVTPTYGIAEKAPTGCTLAGQAAQVRVNGCKYTITGEVSPANTGVVDVIGCTAATPYIQIKSALCELRIPMQNGLSHVVATNIGDGKQVTLNATVSGITVHQVGAACPDGNGHKSVTGGFTGNTLVTAFKPAGTTQVTVHEHQYLENKTGEQVALTST
jgi:hypothetical protein